MHGPTVHNGSSCRKGAEWCGRPGSPDSNACKMSSKIIRLNGNNWRILNYWTKIK